MPHSPEFLPHACAEFPNDNSALHEGVVWTYLSPGGPLKAIRRAAPRSASHEPAEAPRGTHEPSPVPPTVLPAAPGPKDDVILLTPTADSVADVPSAGAELLRNTHICPTIVANNDVEAPPAGKAVAPAEPDAWSALTTAMVSVALAHGSTRAAAILPKFLSDDRVDGAGLDGALLERLAHEGVATISGSQLVATDGMRITMSAWRDVLRGQSEDLSACGSTTLDGWASELLAAFGVTLSSNDIRRELRKKGVAAFGMRLAA